MRRMFSKTEVETIIDEHGGGGGGSAYVLPKATAGKLGGVKANNKTTEDTQLVNIDPDTGLLWTKPGAVGKSGTQVSVANREVDTLSFDSDPQAQMTQNKNEISYNGELIKKNVSDIKTLNNEMVNRYTKPASGIPESDLDSAVREKLNAGGGGGGGTQVSVGGVVVDNLYFNSDPQTQINQLNVKIPTGQTFHYIDLTKISPGATGKLTSQQALDFDKYWPYVVLRMDQDHFFYPARQYLKDYYFSHSESTGKDTTYIRTIKIDKSQSNYTYYDTQISGGSGGTQVSVGGVTVNTLSFDSDPQEQISTNTGDIAALFIDEENQQTFNSQFRTELGKKYVKPSGGIPEIDLAQAVKDKLNAGGGVDEKFVNDAIAAAIGNVVNGAY